MYPYATIRAKALHLASQAAHFHRDHEYAQTLRHIALDCQAADDGCEASAQSVAEYLDIDGRLSGDLAYDAWKAERDASERRAA